MRKIMTVFSVRYVCMGSGKNVVRVLFVFCFFHVCMCVTTHSGKRPASFHFCAYSPPPSSLTVLCSRVLNVLPYATSVSEIHCAAVKYIQ